MSRTCASPLVLLWAVAPLVVIACDQDAPPPPTPEGSVPTNRPALAPATSPPTTTGPTPTSPTGQAAMPTSPSAPAAAPPGDTSALVAALDATMRVTHRIRASVTGAPEGDGEFVVEIQPPDRIHLSMDVASGRTIEMISIGNDMWTNAMGGHFARMPAGAGAAPTAHLADTTSRVRTAITEGRARFHLVGPDTLDGHPMTVWEGEGPMTLDPNPSPDAPVGHGRVWIGDDGHVHRITSEGDVRDHHVSVAVRYEYDPSIHIEPPTG